MRRKDIIPTARTQLGVLYSHQACLEDVATDCGNLIKIVCNKLGYEVDLPTVYAKTPNFLMFKEVVEKYMENIPLEQVQVGDCLTFAFRHEPQHIAFVSSIEPLMVIHASSEMNKVVEQGLKPDWMPRLKAYKFKNLEE